MFNFEYKDKKDVLMKEDLRMRMSGSDEDNEELGLEEDGWSG